MVEENEMEGYINVKQRIIVFIGVRSSKENNLLSLGKLNEEVE